MASGEAAALCKAAGTIVIKAFFVFAAVLILTLSLFGPVLTTAQEAAAQSTSTSNRNYQLVNPQVLRLRPTNPTTGTATACTTRVPSLINLSPDVAEQRLAQSGLEMRIAGRVQSSARADRIQRQNPTARSTIRCGGSVSVVVAVAASGVRVPDVVGRGYDAAAASIQRSGLVPRVRGETSFRGYPGVVAGQRPSAGAQVRDGSRVTIWFEPATGRVPDVTGSSPRVAHEILAKAGYRMVVADRRSSDLAEDQVLDQRPRARSALALGSEVAVTVALAAILVPVPEVTGRSPERAAALLEAAGLEMGVAERFQGEAARDSVARQVPAAGRRVPVGSTVEVAVAEAWPTVTVPEVTGLSPDAALAKIGESFLTGQVVERLPGDGAEDRVERQEPAAGRSVRVGSRVSLTVREAAAMVAVPDLSGLERSAAKAELAALGLALRVGEERSSDAPFDRVSAQRPPPGARVRVGSVVTVELDLARVPPIPRRKPDLVVAETSDSRVLEKPSVLPERVITPELPEVPERPELDRPSIEIQPNQPPVPSLLEVLLRPIAIAFIVLLILAIAMALLLNEGLKRLSGKTAAASPRFVSHADFGIQQLELGGDNDNRPEIRLRPRSDAGLQSVTLAEPASREEERRYA